MDKIIIPLAELKYLPESNVSPVSYNISFDRMWDFFERNPKWS